MKAERPQHCYGYADSLLRPWECQGAPGRFSGALGPSNRDGLGPWVSALRHPQWNDLDWDVHVRLRDAGQRQAAGGYRAFLEEFDRLVQVVTAYLETEPDDRLVSVYAGHAASRLDEYLKSRVIECVVHIDDLAVSAAVETPALPALAMTVTIHELVEMARSYRGDLAVVRALSRRERDAINALRVI